MSDLPLKIREKTVNIGTFFSRSTSGKKIDFFQIAQNRSKTIFMTFSCIFYILWTGSNEEKSIFVRFTTVEIAQRGK